MRTLTPDTIVALKGFAQHYAAMFVADKQSGPSITMTKYTTGRKTGEPVIVKKHSRDWIMVELFNLTYKDEFEFVVREFRQHLGPAVLEDFETRLAQFPTRSDTTFKAMLDEMRPAGYLPQEG